MMQLLKVPVLILLKICSLLMWLIFTGFLIAAYVLQIPKGYNQELLVLGIIYAYFSLFLFFCYVPTTIVTKPWSRCIKSISSLIYSNMGPRTRIIAYAAFVVVVIVVTIFSFPEKEESPRVRRLISLFGLFVFLLSTYAASVVKYRESLLLIFISITDIYISFHL